MRMGGPQSQPVCGERNPALPEVEAQTSSP
jgi:hypothetical protein